jgi:glucose-6-phosphate-specific signal transduction histidine kinase
VVVRVSSPRHGEVAVCVQDHGAGFVQSKHAGLGLQSLRGAVEALGGRLELTSASGQGTSIVGVLPLEGRQGRRSRAGEDPDGRLRHIPRIRAG